MERTGDVELVLARAWSAVARVPTAEGDVWFKEAPAPLSFEPELTALLARLQPEVLPVVIVADGARLLTRDAGRRLRTQLDDGLPAPGWEKLLARHAELQLALASAADAALRLGTLDARPERLLEAASELGKSAAVQLAVDELGDAIPVTVVHTEAHDGNLFIRDGHVRLLDWAEAVVSHPFVGMVLPLRFAAERTGEGPERFRDAYLEPFTGFAPLADLRQAFAHGYLLGTLVRALTWRALEAPPNVTAELGDPVSSWLEKLDGVAEGTIRLGEA